MLKWTIIVLGALVLLLVLVAIIGAMLPRAHVASATARVKRPPEAVWPAITRCEEFPAWRSDVKRVERLPDRDGMPVWREHGRHGSMTHQTEEFVPPRRLKVRIADPGLPFGGTWTWEIEPAEGGASVTITENGEIYNPIFRFMARFVFGYTATTEAYLKSLQQRLDTVGGPS